MKIEYEASEELFDSADWRVAVTTPGLFVLFLAARYKRPLDIDRGRELLKERRKPCKVISFEAGRLPR